VSVNNKLIVVFAGVTATATVSYAILAGWTLVEIHSGSRDTHVLAEAAKRQATKMDTIATSAGEISTTLQSTFGQSQRALNETIAMGRNDQRAWLSTPAIAGGITKDGKSFSFAIPIENTGKTPALDVSSKVVLTTIHKNEHLTFDYVHHSPLNRKSGVLAPQAVRHQLFGWPLRSRRAALGAKFLCGELSEEGTYDVCVWKD